MRCIVHAFLHTNRRALEYFKFHINIMTPKWADIENISDIAQFHREDICKF